MRGRLILISVAILLAVVVMSVIIINYVSAGKSNYYGEEVAKEPPSFEVIGGVVISHEKFMKFVKSKGISIYLPTKLPEGFSLTAIWVRNTSHGFEFPLIIVYSKSGITDYRAREDTLGIEVTRASPAPLEQYVKDGGIPVYNAQGRLIGVIFPDAYCPTCITQKTLPLAIVRIDGLDYLISFKDPEMLKTIILSMKPVTAG
ncbi:MAG: hypothetical protein B6U85_10505 [Desulfurococcales archaeon ex4484_42]|nr:MAG: hypothetical protein B6U85_10505 [Desulfurococcales archaeon ex4484_42]